MASKMDDTLFDKPAKLPTKKITALPKAKPLASTFVDEFDTSGGASEMAPEVTIPDTAEHFGATSKPKKPLFSTPPRPGSASVSLLPRPHTGSSPASASASPARAAHAKRPATGGDESLLRAMSAEMRAPDGYDSDSDSDSSSDKTVASRPADLLKHSLLASIAEDKTLADIDTSDVKTKETVVRLSKARKDDVRAIAEAVSACQRVCLCFVVDTTGSMRLHIDGVKTQITSVVDAIKASGCQVTHVAFVGYKDWCDGASHFELSDFQPDIPSFQSFVGRIDAKGGGDAAEDVMGGLKQALSLSWPAKSGTRVLVHIADAPPHGSRMNGGVGDEFGGNVDGRPGDMKPEEFFERLKQLNVAYYFAEIDHCTKQMVEVFSKCYGKPVDVLDVRDAGTIGMSVTKSVMETVGATSSDATVKHSKGLVSRKYTLEKIEPNFAAIAPSKISVVKYALPQSIEDVISFKPMQSTINFGLAKVAPHPFDCGSVRLAYYAQILFPDKEHTGEFTADPHVFKEYLMLPTRPDLDQSRFMVDLETQTVAAMLAFEFNKRIGKTTVAPYKIKFLVAKVVRFETSPGVFRFMAAEKRYRGAVDMVKFTNNYKFVRRDLAASPSSSKSSDSPSSPDEQVKLCVAFSHFTYEFSREYLLVCDLQGVVVEEGKKKKVLLLTDPAIHCPSHLRFGKTNLQERGIAAFFKTHKCNEYCHALGLSEREV
jgi:hypothetical protein